MPRPADRLGIISQISKFQLLCTEREIILDSVSRYGMKLKILLIKIGDCYSDLDIHKNNNDDDEEDVQGDIRPAKGNQIGKFPGEI